jgi:hypothetical protein
MTNMTELNGASAIKLVRKSAFRADQFDSVSPEAKKIIDSAKPEQILALTITRNSPLKVAAAKVFDRDVFEEILSSK